MRLAGATSPSPSPTWLQPARKPCTEDDYSTTAGLKGQFSQEWNWDLSTTYGRDKDNISTIKSANPSLFQTLQVPADTDHTADRLR